MANNTTIQVRVDSSIKEQTESILDKLGMTISEAIRLYLKQIIMRKEIPFELKIPNTATLHAIEELESGKGETFDNVDALFEDLNN